MHYLDGSDGPVAIENDERLLRDSSERPNEIALGEAVDEALDFVESRLHRHAIEVVRRHTASPRVRALPTALFATCLTVVQQAEESVHAMVGEVVVEVGKRGMEAYVCVSHNGTPISEAGRAAVAELAARAGGRLDAYRGDGRRTYVWFPLAEMRSARTMSVLLVDDEEMLSRMMAAYFESHGSHLTFATTAAEGLAQAREGDFDAIILDLVMPDGNGEQLLAQLKQCVPGVPVIVQSGQMDEETSTRLLEAGAHAVAQKPFSMASLLELCQRSVRVSAPRRFATSRCG